MERKQVFRKGALYVVGTPIGNLSDFSPRALEILEQVDFIAAEDTRVTLKLLTHFGIKKPLISCREHNARAQSEVITARLLDGETCAIVSDAGMPCISDPGEVLVELSAERGIEVITVPGPSALIAALAISGLPTGRFSFEGFLAVNKRQRSDRLEMTKSYEGTLIFYEAPHKLIYTLRDMLEVYGDRRVSVCRELTKLHEEVRRGTLSEMCRYYEQNAPKGEFVLVVEGKPLELTEKIPLLEAVAMVNNLVEQGERLSDASKAIAAKTGWKKSELYKLSVK